MQRNLLVYPEPMGILLFICLLFFNITEALACVTHEEVLAEGTTIESDILFFKTDEHYVVQQHLAYHKGRPYFNFSTCSKDQDKPGFRLKDAHNYELEDCQMLGQWTPVYAPQGNEIVSTLFGDAFKSKMNEYMDSFKTRSVLAPMVSSTMSMIGNYNDMFLLAMSAIVVRQAYVIAPMANTFGGKGMQKMNGRMRAVGIFGLVVSGLGFYVDARSRQSRVDVHKEKLQESVLALTRMEKQMQTILENEEGVRDYPIEARIVSTIIDSIIYALAKIEVDAPSVCLPMQDPNAHPLEKYQQQAQFINFKSNKCSNGEKV